MPVPDLASEYVPRGNPQSHLIRDDESYRRSYLIGVLSSVLSQIVILDNE
ncbi:MAG: hypothetical protein LBU18_04045 [Treponema sp.]|nr:hypothetical protein [Treponema sp.]